MNQTKPESVTQIASIEPTQSAPIDSQNLVPLLTYGGVAVAVIIALTYYNQVLLKLITKLITQVSAKRQNE